MAKKAKHGPTIAELAAKVARAMAEGPHGPELGPMSHAERAKYLFGIDQ